MSARRSRSRSKGYSRHYQSYSRSASRQSYSRSYSRSPNYRHSRSRTPVRVSGRRIKSHVRYNPPVSNCVGVFGLALETEEKDLYKAFSDFGEITDIKLVLDSYTGCSRGFGFIYFNDVESARVAKERGHDMKLDGREIRVDYSITKKAHTPTPGVYLGRKSTRDNHGQRSRNGPRRRYRSRSPYSRSRSRSNYWR